MSAIYCGVLAVWPDISPVSFESGGVPSKTPSRWFVSSDLAAVLRQDIMRAPCVVLCGFILQRPTSGLACFLDVLSGEVRLISEHAGGLRSPKIRYRCIEGDYCWHRGQLHGLLVGRRAPHLGWVALRQTIGSCSKWCRRLWKLDLISPGPTSVIESLLLTIEVFSCCARLQPKLHAQVVRLHHIICKCLSSFRSFGYILSPVRHRFPSLKRGVIETAAVGDDSFHLVVSEVRVVSQPSKSRWKMSNWAQRGHVSSLIIWILFLAFIQMVWLLCLVLLNVGIAREMVSRWRCRELGVGDPVSEVGINRSG